MTSRTSVSRNGDVHYGVSVGNTPTGGTTYAWSAIGRVERYNGGWRCFDQRGQNISFCRTRRDAVSDLRFAWTDRRSADQVNG